MFLLAHNYIYALKFNAITFLPVNKMLPAPAHTSYLMNMMKSLLSPHVPLTFVNLCIAYHYVSPCPLLHSYTNAFYPPCS